MLTSSASQYLHPDYLQPLPTTSIPFKQYTNQSDLESCTSAHRTHELSIQIDLDAKKSPLALLAQTCSSIGKDSGNNKSIIPPLEKKDSQKEKDVKSDTPKSGSGEEKGRSSTASDKKDGSSPGRGLDSPKGGFRAPAPKDIPPLVPITSSSTAGDKSTSSRGSPKTSTSTSSSSSERESTSVTSAAQSSLSSSTSSSSSAGAYVSSNSRLGSLSCSNLMLDISQQESAVKALGLPATHPTLPGSLKADGLTAPSALHPGLSGYPSLPLFGHPLAMDASSMYSNLSGHSALSAAHKGLSPYVSYARVKTSSGATTLVPVCKDPYCTHCQMTMQSAQLSSGCAAGCSQCNHEKSLVAPTSLSAHSGLGSLPLLPHSAASLSLASSLYPHAFGMFPGSQTGLPPYVCNWMAGSDYCGKRFATSDELLQHLRTHTSSTEAAAAALSHAGLPYSALAPSLATACHSHYPTPGSLSPNTLRQAYPRSISPNSLLVANRYHPYKSPLSSLPAPVGSALGSAGLPSLGAYYSPYSLYGQRLGAVAP
ncbi:hypothetical protein LSH36_543g01045 [Paralvinella palmiformis]|uniref:C2H2-type domain-containing protein n=1 Tax=Paralvinella palmiformis TaxID=53620 RepID=A0AAD9J726_9ANNE|nr:hypothetical protein LSH36_543g01045 [Paralvinella palmiformis]